MTFQQRLKRIMKKRGWRVTDLARALGEPYTTVREWVLNGRQPASRSPLAEHSMRELMRELER